MKRLLLFVLLASCARRHPSAGLETASRSPDPSAALSALHPNPTTSPPQAPISHENQIFRFSNKTIPTQIDWLAYGGADGPSSNQLSIEDELLRVSSLLGPDRGVLLYAGGPGTRGVQVLDPPRNATLREQLGMLLDPRPGRDAHFAPLRLAPHFPGTRQTLLDSLEDALQSDGPRLTIWLSGHGLDGKTPDAVGLTAWGLDTIFPKDLKDPFSRARRKARLISTTCYGGGFAEALTAAPTMACGAFAAHWTTTASGCDPNPDAPRTSYGAHLLHAIEGKAPVDDLDKDGLIGLSEAHVYATLAQRGLDKPVLSSQFFLEQLPENATPSPTDTSELFEELALERTLMTRLEVDATSYKAALSTLDSDLEELESQRDDVFDAETEALIALRGALLSRWPELEDPWRYDFELTLRAHGDAIQRFLDTTPESLRYQALRQRLATLDFRLSSLDARRADFDLLDLTRAALENYATRTDESSRLVFWQLRRCEREPLSRQTP